MTVTAEIQTSERPILLIEDDPDIRDLLTLLLQAEGYPVRSAANGVEGLACLRQSAGHPSELPAVILLDFMMPTMDGWEFRKHQKNDPALARIPVIGISADNRVTKKAQGSDADLYVSKPIEVEQLLEKIRSFYGHS